MNQVLAGTTAVIIALLLWGFGKKPRSLFTQNKGSEFLESTTNQELVIGKDRNDAKGKRNQVNSKFEINWIPPKTIQEQILLRKKLRLLMASGPEDRLQAVILADLWAHLTVLPIIRRGLKDANSDVVVAAAKALEKYRGLPIPKDQESDTRQPPRNVALMR